MNNNLIPFKNNSFDTILVLDVIEHVFEPERIFSEIQRLLKNNGHAIISLPHDYYFLNFARMLFFNKPILYEDSFAKKGTHIHFFTIKLMKKMILRHFNVEKIRYFGNNVSVPFLPQKQKNYLASFLPRAFSSNVFFLVRKK